ncbi:MAG: hypothetical protein JWO96_76 [Candidatus Saccharibacteria bacterium]|nr:hypothetical protein [Candidatus Saccharibacteria bacterium]
MEDQAPSVAIKRIEAQVRRVLSRVDIYKLGKRERAVIEQLRQNLNDARIYAQDYELSETREDQLKNAKIAKKWLVSAQANILAASQSDMFSPIEVAHLGAQIEQVMANLK